MYFLVWVKYYHLKIAKRTILHLATNVVASWRFWITPLLLVFDTLEEKKAIIEVLTLSQYHCLYMPYGSDLASVSWK